MSGTPVLDLLNDPKRWTQATNARDANGKDVYSCDPKAVMWCMIGAIERIYQDGVSRGNAVDALDNAIDILHDDLDSKCIGDFNDTHTHEQVIRLLKEAKI